MWRKFWTVAVAFLFLICLASIADAQRRPSTNRKAPDGIQQPGNANNGNQGNNSGNNGNGNQNDPPGNGEEGEDPPGGGTPDGETPADEDVCDQLKGATPGLYGLCIAFCEAHDCVPDFSLENPLANCKKNDRKLLDKYRQKMRDGDPDMPCVPSQEPQEPGGGGEEPQVACPCWGPDQLAAFPNWDPFCTFEMWNDLEGDGSCWQEVNDIYDSAYFADDDYTEFWVRAAKDDGCADGTYCFWWFDCVGGACPEVPFGELWLDISDEEFEACKEQIRQVQEVYCY